MRITSKKAFIEKVKEGYRLERFKEYKRTLYVFCKKELFEIGSTPTHLPLKDNNGSKGYWINRKWLSLSAIQRLIQKEEKTVDVSDLQWYQQIQLDEVFNLK